MKSQTATFRIQLYTFKADTANPCLYSRNSSESSFMAYHQNSNINRMSQALDLFSKGYFLRKGFFSEDNVRTIKLMHEKAILSTRDPSEGYSGGKLARVHISENNLSKKSIIRKRVNSIRKFLAGNFDLNAELHGETIFQPLIAELKEISHALTYRTTNEIIVYYTSDNKYTIHSAQAPHFDWRPCLKAMIYLDDCTEVNQGGLFICDGTHAENRLTLAQERMIGMNPGQSDASKYFENSISVRKEFTYCGGNSGDVLFFLTDNYHYQGKNNRDAYNRIARIHAYLDR